MFFLPELGGELRLEDFFRLKLFVKHVNFVVQSLVSLFESFLSDGSLHIEWLLFDVRMVSFNVGDANNDSLGS